MRESSCRYGSCLNIEHFKWTVLDDDDDDDDGDGDGDGDDDDDDVVGNG